MEKIQVRDSGAVGRADSVPVPRLGQSALALHFLTATEFAGAMRQQNTKILGVAGFGPASPIVENVELPLLNLALPTLDGEPVFEVWSSNQPVQKFTHSEIRGAHTGNILFGCFEIVPAAAATMQQMSYAAYTRLFNFLDEAGFPYLWRIWHYLPDINGADFGQERYHGFNVGRHEALLSKGRRIGGDQVPAACALGSQGKSLAVYFLAARGPGIPIENPRQTSADHYPPQYGPRSPTFARAMLTEFGGSRQFFISGTASIVGHASQHIGDIEAQTRETLLNVQTLLAQARAAGLAYPDSAARLKLKVYLHRANDLACVQAHIRAALGEVEAVYLQADVCRSELLLEIEGVCIEAVDPIQAREQA